MVAFLANEQGVDVVEDLYTEPGSVCYAHIYNLCEVYYLFYRRAGVPVAHSVIEDLLSLGIVPRNDSEYAILEGRRLDQTPSNILHSTNLQHRKDILAQMKNIHEDSAHRSRLGNI